jgi:uncharacterized protein (TIGR02145 family)
MLRKSYRIILIVALGLSLLPSCKDKPLPSDEMKDAAGNRYKTVTIGEQVRMAENLKALYTNAPNSRNGNYISANFFLPDNDSETHSTYGLLYPFDGAKDLLPKGWHIPTLHDIDKLLNTLGADYETGSDAVCAALNINVYPGTNESDFVTIGKYFSLMLDEPSTNVELDYRTLFFYARDYPDSELFRKTIYHYNVTRSFAGSVRFDKDGY